MKKEGRRLKNNTSDEFARKAWLLYFNRVLLKNQIISVQDYRRMQQKIYGRSG